MKEWTGLGVKKSCAQLKVGYVTATLSNDFLSQMCQTAAVMLSPGF